MNVLIKDFNRASIKVLRILSLDYENSFDKETSS